MLYEEPRETELAFKIADRIVSIQECDGGYDYSIMDEHYREIDGGVYDDPAVDINFVLLSIVEELKENPDTNGAKGNITKESKLIPLDYDEVAERADIANMAGPAVYSSRVIMEFKAKTEECSQPIDGLGATEIEELVQEYVTTKPKKDNKADNQDKTNKYLTQSLSKYGKKEQKLISRIYVIIKSILPKDMAEMVVKKIQEELSK